MMPYDLSVMRALRQNLDPIRPLRHKSELDRFYHPRAIAEMKRLREAIRFSAPSEKFLVTSHSGCGESTELANLAQQLQDEDGFHVVSLSALEFLILAEVDYPDLFLALATKLQMEVQEVAPEKAPGLLDRWEGVVREFRVDQAELKAGWNPFGLALRLQRVKPDERALLRQTLIDELGNLAAQIQGAVEILAQADQTDQELPVLIILDDLDKCEAGQVIEVFDRYARQLAGLPCRLLATVPLDLYLCEQHLRIASYFPNVIYLPLIRPTQPDGSEDPRGLADLEAMFRKRVEDVGVVVEELIEAESLRALSIASGGLPRQLMRLGQECLVRLAIAPDATKITVPIVQEAISDVADAFAIVRVDAELSTDLRRVRDCEDKHVPPLSRDRLCELLSLLYVLQYGDGETWYDVNPFVSPLL